MKSPFKYNRLTYGISSTPLEFQELKESLFRCLKAVIIFLDHVLVTGKDEIDHWNMLKNILKILKISGSKLSSTKCVFFQNSVKYFGYLMKKDVLHRNIDKT